MKEYTNWRPRRCQSRSTKTSMKRLSKMVHGGWRPSSPASWVCTVPIGTAKTLTMEDMVRIHGILSQGLKPWHGEKPNG